MKKMLAGIILIILLGTLTSMCISNNTASTIQSSTTATQPSESTPTGTTSTHEQEIDITKLHFYMFGAAGCPHCGRMKKLLPEIFGKDKFTYYELQGNEHNTQLFSELYDTLGITGVPVIGIFYDGHLVAVIEGEIPDPAKNVPLIVNTALKENGVLFIADRTYLIPSNQTEIIKKLETIFMNGEPSEG
ncbi:thioredoxin [Thermococcus sp. M39]|uniref:thioredoxin family protein n=1 Tax=unclassified Thermococcus TaxID=2627626 RepID=UPI00143A2333|nr:MULTISPECIES: thioredoxin family protein [unclassified Thermococcus]NJE07735.1 thioredoxin [Thermococcus sp. M39]NJE12291.1 thioredoxin [Thermococcus sp. LS2]